MEYSIILATLVRKKRHIPMVEKCIALIKTFSKDYELIIVDDCSPLHAEYLKEQADTYIRHEGGNKGCAVSWNDGLKVAKGKYLVIISDDVYVNEGWLECMKNALSLFPNALASMPHAAMDLFARRQSYLLNANNFLIVSSLNSFASGAI